MQFEWDPEKDRKNQLKQRSVVRRGVDGLRGPVGFDCRRSGSLRRREAALDDRPLGSTAGRYCLGEDDIVE